MAMGKAIFFGLGRGVGKSFGYWDGFNTQDKSVLPAH